MSGEILRSVNAQALWTPWQQLWAVSSQSECFTHPSWLIPWWSTLGKTSDPYLAVVRIRDEFQGVAPLTRHRSPFGDVLRPAGEGVSDYTDWLLPDQPNLRTAARDDLVKLLAGQADWTGLELPGLRNETDAGELQRAFEHSGIRTRLLAGMACPFVSMPNGFNAYYATRNAQTRYNVRSRERRLSQMGTLRYVHATAKDAPRLLEDAIDLHARRWQGQHTSTVFSAAPLGRAFYRATIPDSVRHEFGDIAALMINDRVIATSIGFVRGSRYAYYLPAWHPGYHPYAPSTLLLVHLMEFAADRGASTFDFMLGDEPYKATWATGQTRVHTLIAHKPTPAGQIWARGRLLAHALKNRVRSSPELMSLRRYGFGALGRVVSRTTGES
ncbi:MAG: GNAT family N-acetyltransferase [Chloroflexota bacterium]